MTDPKKRLLGLKDLGQAVDERVQQATAPLDMRHDTGQAPLSTLTGGGVPGGSSAAGAPALPEHFVTSLRSPANGNKREGDIALRTSTASTLSIIDSTTGSAAEFTLTAKSSLSVEILPGAGDPGLLYRRTTDNTLWWDRDGSGLWTQLDVNGLDTHVKVTSDDTTAGFLLDKLVAGNGVSISELNDGGNEALQINSIWSRSNNQISPAEAGDQLQLESSGNDAGILSQSEDAEAIFGQANGAGAGVRGVSSAGFGGDFASSASHGLVARTSNSASYSILALECTHAGDYLDLDQQGQALATPGSEVGRLHLKDDKRAYLLDDSGASHDLTLQHSQVFTAVSGQVGAGTPEAYIAVLWATAAFPSGASAASVAGSGNNASFTMPTGGGFATVGDAFARLEWTSQNNIPNEVSSGAQVALAQCLQRRGGKAKVRARVRVNNLDRFDRIELALCDSGSHSSGSGNLLGSLSSNAWHELELGELDVSAWGDNLRIIVSAQGTSDDSKVGLTRLDLEFLEVRMWEN